MKVFKIFHLKHFNDMWILQSPRILPVVVGAILERYELQLVGEVEGELKGTLIRPKGKMRWTRRS